LLPECCVKYLLFYRVRYALFKVSFTTNLLIRITAVCTSASPCVAGPLVTLNPGDPGFFESKITSLLDLEFSYCLSFCISGK
jgi:hypothetical protein